MNNISKKLQRFNFLYNISYDLPDMQQIRYTHSLLHKENKIYALGGRSFGVGI